LQHFIVAELTTCAWSLDVESRMPITTERDGYFGILSGVPVFQGRNAKPVSKDLRKLIDRSVKRITSVTGELTWDYGGGLLTVNTPKSQAVTGFLSKAGVVTLGDLRIDSSMEYGTVHVISLDDRPLATSSRILIQAFSEEKLYGFRAENGVIKDVGRVPINVRDIQASVTFTNAAGLNATVLDANGYATGNASPVANGTLSLQRDAMYTIVTRRPFR